MLERYFDVETEDVKRRALRAVNVLDSSPFLGNVPDTVESGKRPDLWGPFWIYQTVVFSHFFSASAGALFSGSQYDIASFAASASIMALFTFGVPMLVWLAVQYLNLVPTFTWGQSLCLYGYSNVVWVPIVVLKGILGPVLPTRADTIVNWVLLLVGFIVSGKFLLFNLRALFFNAASESIAIDKSKGTAVLVLCALVQLAFTVAVGSVWGDAGSGVPSAPGPAPVPPPPSL